MIELVAAVLLLVAGVIFYRRKPADGNSYGNQGAVILLVIAVIVGIHAWAGSTITRARPKPTPLTRGRAMIGFVPVGILAALAGTALVLTGIAAGRAAPRNMVMLIGGMMLAAFGIIIAGFAIVYSDTAPLDLNSGAAR